jgi:O-succinylbenzoate synthase
MVSVGGGKDLVGYGEIAVVPEFREETADDCFIVFRHEWFSF